MREYYEMLLEGTEWEVGYYGDTLICPCGDEIEIDGQCPQGCVSPILRMGMI